LVGLLGLMIIASFAEIFSLGAVIPFLSALVAPEKIFHHPQAQLFIQGLNIQNEKELLLPRIFLVYEKIETCILDLENTLINHRLPRSWQTHIAHVPQSIFLSATTIAENIVFGVPRQRIDIHQVKQCAEMTQISGTIEN